MPPPNRTNLRSSEWMRAPELWGSVSIVQLYNLSCEDAKKRPQNIWKPSYAAEGRFEEPRGLSLHRSS